MLRGMGTRLLVLLVIAGGLAGCALPGTDGRGASAAGRDAGPACQAGSGESHAGHRMTGPRFANRSLRCAVFDGSELTRPDFRGADLSTASFRDAGLVAPDFRGATLVGATFAGTRIADPSFVDADLRGAELRAATLTGADWAGSVCPDGVRADDAGASCDQHLDPTAATASSGAP
jgi:uncharacterized protein YjbI with pentapeptide repeats